MWFILYKLNEAIDKSIKKSTKKEMSKDIFIKLR